MTTATLRGSGVHVDRLDVAAYRIPTDRDPETDGTARWSATTIVVVEIHAGGEVGTGWTYGTPAVAAVIDGDLRTIVEGADALATRKLWTRMTGRVRNAGRSGIASYAIAAVDVALWDLHARLLGAALCDALGIVRDAVPIYGSGGFTSYDIPTLQQQLAGWAHDGIIAVKMKAGRDHAADPGRVAAAREAIGPHVQLFVDANGGYDVASALAFAHGALRENGVTWFEQPVDHDDIDGTRRVRDHAPPGLAVSSGEYITNTAHAALIADAVDVVQADATRCGGYTGFLAIDGFCDVSRKPLSTHCAPMLHLHVAAAALRVRHLEWFHDHVRIERRLFDGFIEPVHGKLSPDRSRPGHGLTFKHADARRLAI